MKAVVKAPAKINFTLDITGRLPNGYHTVDMIMQSVGLYDTVTVASSDKIRISSDKPFVPRDKSNTAYKAAEYFFEYTGKNGGADIFIQKLIPVQAGLAGGSTDAAAVLVALDEMFNTKLSNKELSELGAKVGADVPFCIFGGTMLSTGIGTTLEKVSEEVCDMSILLCKPMVGISTKEAYALADSRPYSQTVHSTSFINALKNKDFAAMCGSIYNDFESLVNVQEVQKIKRLMEKNGADKSSMSGSGPTVFGVFQSKERAQSCAEILQKEYKEVFLTKPVFCGCKIISTE